jgi:hypothetical protein
MTLNSAAGMTSAFDSNVESMRLFGSVESIGSDIFTIDPDLTNKFCASFYYTQKSSLIANIRRAPVLRIDCERSFSQVAPNIVVSIPIEMIDSADRPLTSHVKPSKTMRLVQDVVDTDKDVASRMSSRFTTGNFSTSSMIGKCSAPRKKPGFGRICSHFVESLSGQQHLHGVLS